MSSKKPKISLAWQMMIGLALGVVVGALVEQETAKTFLQPSCVPERPTHKPASMLSASANNMRPGGSEGKPCSRICAKLLLNSKLFIN